ncbi:myosin heavy chain, non-muscle-like [Drosophila sulfurigaster albostrigata]|uniref:myosin heavy chain, non-muscle-like n=1 Tax=Drosophila sulfurigaster albostrigata TaxID=89887 RepID=UPI002D219AB4|nr:myosin heavy chain, non-muscle-like [Drosophila sulfurigaster albostrigata]
MNVVYEESATKATAQKAQRELESQLAEIQEDLEAEKVARSKAEKLRRELAKELEEGKERLNKDIEALERQVKELMAQNDRLDKSKKKIQSELEDAIIEMEAQRTKVLELEKKQKNFDKILAEEKAISEQIAQERDTAEREAREKETVESNQLMETMIGNFNAMKKTAEYPIQLKIVPDANIMLFRQAPSRIAVSEAEAVKHQINEWLDTGVIRQSTSNFASRLVVVKKMDVTTKHEEVLQKLRNWSDVFGNPCRIISDRGSAFTSAAFESYVKENGIEHIWSTTGVPRGNGQVERVNRSILAIISKLSADKPDKWFKFVPKVQRVINGTTHKSTKHSPFELMFGVKMRNDADCRILQMLDDEMYNSFDEERQKTRQEAKDEIQHAQDNYKKRLIRTGRTNMAINLRSRCHSSYAVCGW